MQLSLSVVCFVLLAGGGMCAPLPAPQTGDPTSEAAVLLRLNDTRTARCRLWGGQGGAAAELVSSRLVASGRLACKQATRARGATSTTVHCDSGQNVTPDEADATIRDACSLHNGVHDLF